MEKIIIKQKYSKLFRKGPNIILADYLKNLDKQEQKQFVQFIDEHNQFLGTGYLGAENKGIGWLLTTNKQPINTNFFINALQKAKEERTEFFANQEMTNAFRIVNGIADQLGGITIDYYDNYLVISLYNQTIEQKLQAIVSAIYEVYPNVKGIYVKYRYKNAKQDSRFIWGELAPEPLIVKENYVQYATYLNEGLMTGIFLDQHNARKKLVEGAACGQKVLNLFSYTGAFSVAAAMGGALETTSVDLAKRSLPKTREMFEVNGLDLAAHKIVVMDTFDFCKWAQKKELQYEMIILDPPSFARNGKKTWSVAKDYTRLVAAVLPLLSPNGVLIASTNASNVSLDKFKMLVEKGFKQKNRRYKLEALDKLPADFKTVQAFPQGDYLKVLTYRAD